MITPPTPYTEPDLVRLLRRIAARDHAAMAEFHSCTSAALSASVRRILRDRWQAEEVVQDVYVYVWLHAGSYIAGRGTPRTWLHVLGRSRAIDRLRRCRHDAHWVDDCDHPAPACDPVRETGDVWWHDKIRRGVHQLPDIQERLIEMAFWQGYSHAEIAQTTGIPLGTVKTRIRGALSVLREALPKAA